jgi:hypothetical protein
MLIIIQDASKRFELSKVLNCRLYLNVYRNVMEFYLRQIIIIRTNKISIALKL